MLENFQQEQNKKEDTLNILLSKLPKEIASAWRAKTDDMDDIDHAILMVENVTKERSIAKEKVFTRIHEIVNPEIQDEVRSVVGSIEATFGNSDFYLGEGTVGKVYATSYAPHVCVKYIMDSNMLERHGNTMRQEVQYLVDLDGFEVEGIKVPRVYFQHMSDSLVCFGMETIDGKSLDQIISDPDGCEFIEVLRKQNQSEVLQRMRQFISKLHSDMKIVHRDLATRNIMVDKNGNWYVIDFGKGKRIEIGDSSTEMSEATDFPSAENAIRKYFAAIA